MTINRIAELLETHNQGLLETYEAGTCFYYPLKYDLNYYGYPESRLATKEQFLTSYNSDYLYFGIRISAAELATIDRTIWTQGSLFTINDQRYRRIWRR